MPLSSKLCFVGADHARGLQSDGDAGKQSFQDKCVTKLELGHEGISFIGVGHYRHTKAKDKAGSRWGRNT